MNFPCGWNRHGAKGSWREPGHRDHSRVFHDLRKRQMSFQDFFNALKQKASELKTEALKFKNRDFLNAAVSGSVLVSMADGIISSEEKQKMMRFIENYEPLSVFSAKELIDAFQNA